MTNKSKKAAKAAPAAAKKAAKKTAKAAKKEAKPSKSAATKQVFSYTAPNAMSVMLAGEFTHWQSEAIPMKRGKDGVWKVSVALAPGVHHYRFIVDGKWLDDPECELRVPNPYGGHNSVRTVE
jgi:1,4-alpha-glucan branching enzyme